MFEGEPGLFYILSFLADNVHGASIVTITSDGKFNTVYSFGPEVEILSLAQSTNRELYGPTFTSPSLPSYYFSIEPSGKNLQEYPFPGKVGSTGQTTVALPGEVYDIVGVNPAQGSRVFGFARIDNSGKIIILHQFSGATARQPGATLCTGRMATSTSATNSSAA